jgi:hypothetical protein
VQLPALTLAEWRSGARFDEVRLADSLSRTRCPVLTIDRLESDEDFQRVSDFLDAASPHRA